MAFTEEDKIILALETDGSNVDVIGLGWACFASLTLASFVLEKLSPESEPVERGFVVTEALTNLFGIATDDWQVNAHETFHEGAR